MQEAPQLEFKVKGPSFRTLGLQCIAVRTRIIYLHVCTKASVGHNITTWVAMTQSPSSRQNNALSHKVVSESMCVRICV